MKTRKRKRVKKTSPGSPAAQRFPLPSARTPRPSTFRPGPRCAGPAAPAHLSSPAQRSGLASLFPRGPIRSSPAPAPTSRASGPASAPSLSPLQPDAHRAHTPDRWGGPTRQPARRTLTPGRSPRLADPQAHLPAPTLPRAYSLPSGPEASAPAPLAPFLPLPRRARLSVPPATSRNARAASPPRSPGSPFLSPARLDLGPAL